MISVVHELEPVFDPFSRILILGTMPSPRSRIAGFYYAHPQNRFWPIMAELFNTPPLTDNETRRDFLLRQHIALWDVLASCTINGADDSSIHDAVANPIETLLAQTEIHTIFTTGAKAAALYKRLCLPRTGVEAVSLPSTSPANCRNWSYRSLCEVYRVVKNALFMYDNQQEREDGWDVYIAS